MDLDPDIIEALQGSAIGNREDAEAARKETRRAEAQVVKQRKRAQRAECRVKQLEHGIRAVRRAPGHITGECPDDRGPGPVARNPKCAICRLLSLLETK